MTHAVSLRTMSLSLSTAFWIALVAAMLAVGPRVAHVWVPAEPRTIEGVRIVEPPPAPLKRSIDPVRIPDGPLILEPTPLPVDVAPPTAEPVTFTPAPVEAPQLMTNPVWLQRPTSREVARFYPRRAIERGRSGVASLDCLVRIDGALACQIASEEPAGWGFGAAALQLSASYRMQPATRGGQPVEARYRLRVPFELN